MSTHPSESPEQLALQQVVAGRYSLVREIGRGGMGAVFLATDVVLERRVAIKLLLPHLARDEALRTRFLREAKTAAQLMHPNIVPLHAVEAHDDLLFFVMSYVDGETLTQRVQRVGRLPGDEAVRLVQELAWALSYAHAQGVVHRDIKPDNILIERGTGRAMITDFGIARVASRDTVSEPGSFVGTLHYMSPEQALGESIDGRSDLYSLGATAFYAVTGQPPIDGQTLPVLINRLQTEAPPSVGTFRSDVSPVLVDAVARCLRKTAGERFDKAEELALALRDAQTESVVVPVEIRMLIRELGTVTTFVTIGLAGLVAIPLLLWNGSISSETAMGLFAVALLFPAVGLAGVLGQVLQAVRKGIALDDFDAPLKVEADRLVAERDAYLERAWDARAIRMNRWLAITMIVLGVILELVGAVASRRQHWSGAKLEFGIGLAVCIAACGVWSAWTLRFLKPGLRPPRWYMAGNLPVAPTLRILRRLLRSKWIRRLFRHVGAPASTPAAAPAVPTATLLVRRVEELVKDLPPALRRGLGDVGSIASRLESAIQTLRDRMTRLDAAMAEVGPQHPSHADFSLARAAASKRLSDATSALETLRADLLRLQAGLVGAQGITADLDRVRELGMNIDAELFGLDSVRQTDSVI